MASKRHHPPVEVEPSWVGSFSSRESSLSLDPDSAEEPEAVSDSPAPVAGVAMDSPPAASESRAASAAAVGSEAPVCTGVEALDAEPLDVEAPDEDGAEKPAAGRSGKRTSTYSAPAALGEVSTRASDIHLACGRVASPKYTSKPLLIATVRPSGPL